MRCLYKLMLSLNATIWMWVLYVTKEKLEIAELPFYMLLLGLVVLAVILSFLSLYLLTFYDKESVKNVKEASLADNDFVPVYLGYFFVALSAPDLWTMIIVYILVFVCTYFSQAQYFNPLFLVLGYHYYNVLSERGTHIFVVKRGKVIRNAQDLELENLRRLNDMTFVEKRGNQ